MNWVVHFYSLNYKQLENVYETQTSQFNNTQRCNSDTKYLKPFARG